MKRIIALLLALALAMPLTALAGRCEYANTQAFCDLMDAEEIEYTWYGTDDEDDEVVILESSGDGIGDYDIYLYFYEDESSASMACRVWEVITYDPARFSEVVEACNTLNASWRYITFYADTNDNTVTVSFDVVTVGGSAAQTCYGMISRLVSILEKAYPDLAPYNTK